MTYAQLPANTVTQVKRALLDTIGVTLAGHGEDTGRLVTAWVEDIGGRQEAAAINASRLPVRLVTASA